MLLPESPRSAMPQAEIRMAVLADQDPIPQDRLDDDLDTLRDAARLIYPGVGSMLYDWWEEINETHFGRQMTPPGIQFGLTPHGSRYGAWRGYEHTITLHRSLLDASGNAWGQGHKLGHRFAWDVLLHEMVHQYIDTVRGISGSEAEAKSPSDSVHNSPSWVAEINRLSQELELDCTASVIRQRRVDGSDPKWIAPEGFDLERISDLSSWPHSVRPDEYYEEDPNPSLDSTLRDQIRQRRRKLRAEEDQADGQDPDEQDRDLDEIEQDLENELNKIFQ